MQSTSLRLAAAAIRAVTPALALLLLASCGGSGDAGGSPPPSQPAPPSPPADPLVSGLDARPGNASCLAGDAPSGDLALSTEQVFAGVGAFSQPILMLQEPSSTARWYVVQQGGTVYVFDNQPGVTSRRVFINLEGAITSGGEAGLLGMAFHPGWPANPRVYFSYTAMDGSQLVSRVVEYTTTDGGATAAANSARTILQVNQPAANHNGGHMAFGPDGLLYIGLGDGGGGGDPWGSIGNGQRLSTLLGKVLRINVDSSTGATPYAIPAGNPYAGGAVCNFDTGAFTHNCPEIHAYGLRNPWRWSFDSVSGELWLGDVGQGEREEVNRVVSGGNYGWRCREGSLPFNNSCGPNAGSAIAPVAEYGRAQGASITGGYVYRGSAIAQLANRYVFGDFISGRIWHIARNTSPTQVVTAGFDSGLNISSFAQGADGEIHVVHYGGTLHRLVASTGGSAGGPPAQLSATGCVVASNAAQPASGLIPYAPNAPFWSDGATKQRFMALPAGQAISIGSDGDFGLPTGSVLMKHFRLGDRLVETRLFMRHNNGNWAGYTYEWNGAGTDATRVIGGKSVVVEGQNWLFPSETQCLSCHTEAAGRSLGLEVAQLNGPFNYTLTGRNANQLATLNAIGTLTSPLSSLPTLLPALPNPLGTEGSLDQRARAYLHTNCSHCHRPGGPTGVGLDLRYNTPLGQTNACEATPVRDLGVAGARVIAVGGSNPAGRSLLVLRAAREDADAMPPLLPRVADAAGVALLTAWVNALTSCGS